MKKISKLICIIMVILSCTNVYALDYVITDDLDYQNIKELSEKLDFELLKERSLMSNENQIEKVLKRLNNVFYFNQEITVVFTKRGAKIPSTNMEMLGCFTDLYENRGEEDETNIQAIWIFGAKYWYGNCYENTIIHEVGHVVFKYLTSEERQAYQVFRGLGEEWEQKNYASDLNEIFARDFAYVFAEEPQYPIRYLHGDYIHPKDVEGLKEFILSLQDPILTMEEIDVIYNYMDGNFKWPQINDTIASLDVSDKVKTLIGKITLWDIDNAQDLKDYLIKNCMEEEHEEN